MRNLGLAVCFLFLTACASKPTATTEGASATATPAASEHHHGPHSGMKKGCMNCAEMEKTMKEKKTKPCGCKE